MGKQPLTTVQETPQYQPPYPPQYVGAPPPPYNSGGEYNNIVQYGITTTFMPSLT
jgi:hypothetical protein